MDIGQDSGKKSDKLKLLRGKKVLHLMTAPNLHLNEH
jgi:hypothetical protein